MIGGDAFYYRAETSNGTKTDTSCFGKDLHFHFSAISVVLLAGLLPISIIRNHHIHNEWSKYADRFVKARALFQSMNSPAAIAKYNDHSLLQIRLYPLGADINELT